MSTTLHLFHSNIHHQIHLQYISPLTDPPIPINNILPILNTLRLIIIKKHT